MKYFLFAVLLICLGDCADYLGSKSSGYSPGSNYGSMSQLSNYDGIYSPRYDVNSYYDYIRQGNKGEGSYGLRGQSGSLIGNNEGSGGYIASNLGLAGLGLSAALGAGVVGNLGNAIGFGINSNLQLNVDANIDISNNEDIVRPCNLDDWQCMRKFFAENSQCSPTYGPVPDPLFFAQSTLNVPLVNLNVLLTNVKITGLGSVKIKDFYVNRVTGNVVFTIEMQNLNLTSPRCYTKYHRRGKEPIILADVSAFALAQLSLTIVIPRVPYLRLDLAEIYPDYDDESPKYEFGPGILNSTDSLVVSANAQLSANLQTAIRESFQLQVQLLAAIYIQQSICDFGMKLSSI